MLDVDTLAGKSFLDIGSGSGLLSLAARRMGAQVRSFDLDPMSVACTCELKRRYCPDDPAWVIESGSVLDRQFVEPLGRFEIVYSWGVLHHTGAMWEALANAADRVAANGLLFIAIYNHQRYWSRFNFRMKRLYVRSRRPLQVLLVGGFAAATIVRGLAKDVFTLRHPLRRYRKVLARGMSPWHDWVDWVGGYPFEVATPEEVLDFLRLRGFELTKIVTRGGGHGCNEFVFRRSGATQEMIASPL